MNQRIEVPHDCDLTITALRQAVVYYNNRAGVQKGVKKTFYYPTSLLVDPRALETAYEVVREAGLSKIINIIGIPGWWNYDAWMLVGDAGYTISEGA
jgi:hypothetical protein